MPNHHDVLIVGSGHAGAQAAITLRQRGFSGTIGLIGEDPELPYERPPLSKEYLACDRPFEKMLLRPASFWPDAQVTLVTDICVTDVDADARRVTLEGGETADYGTLIWATGGHARRLTCSGHDLRGVHAVRSRVDVDQLLAELPSVNHVVVIGGGFIGMEAAAVLTKLGKSVTLLEAQERVLARVCGAEVSAFYEGEHRAHGVDIRTGATVACIDPTEDGRVAAVALASGERIACDMVIVGVGIVPAVEPLRAAGARCDAGVIVDALGRTSLPDIYAIGDCVTRPSAHITVGAMRIESVQNANVTAAAAVAAIMGAEPAAEPLPWFWSNQFDLKLQTAGINAGYDGTAVRGDPAQRSFAVAYLAGDRLLAVDCINAPKLFAQSKKLIGDRARIDTAAFADPATTPADWPLPA